MKIVIAPDSFKESLTAKQVCEAIQQGLMRVWPNAEYLQLPVADGGEGTVQSLVDATAGKIIHQVVKGPLGEDVDAFYGILGDTQTAVIEMAAASGLHHIPMHLRNPMNTGSYGTGELICHALELGVKRIIIGLGGSATNDGGIGMLAALGIRFTNKQGLDVPLNGTGLCQLAAIDTGPLDSRISACEIIVACDVANPLCGENGASVIFGPQKGASPKDIQQLDSALSHYAGLIEKQTGQSVDDLPGAGAAGGMGAALYAFLNPQLKPGISIVSETLEIEKKLQGTDLVFTGEGRIDGQTTQGKAPIGIAQLAKQRGIPVIALAGCTGQNYQAVYAKGIDTVFTTLPKAMSLQEAFDSAPANLADTAENIARLWQIASGHPL